MVALRAAALVAVFCLLPACISTHLEQPTLSVVSVEFIKGDLLSQQLRVRMRVQNPNNRALPVRGLTYEVELGGKAFAHGDSVSEFLVPANGGAEFDVNVTANAASALLRLLGNSEARPAYRIFGKVRLASGLVRNIPFDHAGTLNLR
jgi:LEA14-like dessication related protein